MSGRYNEPLEGMSSFKTLWNDGIRTDTHQGGTIRCATTPARRNLRVSKTQTWFGSQLASFEDVSISSSFRRKEKAKKLSCYQLENVKEYSLKFLESQFPLVLACSRLRDGGGKSFSKKKFEKSRGLGRDRAAFFPTPPPPFPSRARLIFALLVLIRFRV